jgi:hypothetical protein
VPRIVRVLERCKQRDVSQDYTYYGLASPWLQVKCLRVLQYFPPPEEPAVRRMLAEVIKRILGGESAGVWAGGELPAAPAAGNRGAGAAWKCCTECLVAVLPLWQYSPRRTPDVHGCDALAPLPFLSCKRHPFNLPASVFFVPNSLPKAISHCLLPLSPPCSLALQAPSR